MSLNSTPSAERIHIGIFGKRNAGKSSIINAITGQELAIVSAIKGTTTDPVLKSMELLPLGPVVLIDTPGLDDTGELGGLRIQKAYQILNKTDIALLVVDEAEGMTAEDTAILTRIQKKHIPYVIALNKADLTEKAPASEDSHILRVSASSGFHIQELKELLASQISDAANEKHIVGDLIAPSDFIVLVVPIDKSAPKGRLILPLQQTIRDILDSGASAIVVKEDGLKETLSRLGFAPKLVITDSQVFKQVAAIVPDTIALTSFSILLARYKGYLAPAIHGAKALSSLHTNDRVLIAEGCTHHRQCEDIGTVKLPHLIRQYTKQEPQFEFTSGGQFPENLSPYKLIIHCGGCMLNDREMKYRITCAEDAAIPVTNYGIAIAQMSGILERSIAMLPLND